MTTMSTAPVLDLVEPSIGSDDARLARPDWDASEPGTTQRVRSMAVALVGTMAALAYLLWLVQPERVGNPILFGVLLVAELFNVTQALGFWWTCAFSPRRKVGRTDHTDHIVDIDIDVDVFIPTYDEPVEIVEATVAAAVAMRGARVRVWLLDDGDREAMRRLADRHGARHVRREVHSGAKAGNINHALGLTDAPYVVVLDCDHVPHTDFLARTLPRFADDDNGAVAFVQTPQYYANAAENRIADASWSQQSLFFGPIAQGKDARRAMFCCGTNVVFRRDALESVGGFPEDSVTEDFELSIELHERGWESAYVPDVLASGLGPEDLGAYVSQQHRWARGCVGALPRILSAGLPWRQKVHYLLSASYFLTGWTVLIYLSMPVIRILFGAQPVGDASADGFLTAFVPYFGLAVVAVATVGGGRYTFAAYALAASTFWVHVHASVRALLRRPSRFVVTPKQGASQRQWRAAGPTLAVIGVLVVVIVFGLVRDRTPATINNVAFALFHIAILSHGISTALIPGIATITAHEADEELATAA